MLIYLAIGAVIGLITLLIALSQSSEEDRYIKAKQLATWACVFVIATLLWPAAVFLGFCWVMGNA